MFTLRIFGSQAETLVNRAETRNINAIAKVLAAEADRTASLIRGHAERNHIADRMQLAFDQQNRRTK